MSYDKNYLTEEEKEQRKKIRTIVIISAVVFLILGLILMSISLANEPEYGRCEECGKRLEEYSDFKTIRGDRYCLKCYYDMKDYYNYKLPVIPNQREELV